jgi:hypothetical protein
VRDADPNQGVTVSEIFFETSKPVQRDFPGMKKLRRLLVQWAVIAPAPAEQTQPLAIRLPVAKPTTQPAGNHVSGPFVAVNKNLCNFPLARDYHSQDWQRWQGDKSGRWYVDIKREGIRFTFAPDIDKATARCPDGFDMNVLLLILGTAQHRGNPQVTFQSRSEMLRTLRYGTDTRQLRRLDATLAFWQAASLRMSKWYVAKRGKGPGRRGWRRKGGTRGVHELPPPIEVQVAGGRVKVRIADAWLALNDDYFEKVPLPLPRQAATQNLVLMMMVSRDQGPEFVHQRPQRSFCRKLGLNHRRRNQVLARAMEQAEAWFQQHGFVVQQRPRRQPAAKPKASIKRRRLSPVLADSEAKTEEMPTVLRVGP